MATFGSIKEYEQSEDWTQYQERLENYFDANDITEEGKKKSILLSVVGAQAYQLIRNLVAPTKPKEKSFEELCEAMNSHYNPKPSEIVQRFKFHCRSRKSGESVPNFIAELRHLSEHCNFEDQLENQLRDRLVCGINDVKMQKRLLSETTLTFKKAVEIATSMEIAAKNAEDLQMTQQNSTSTVNKMDQVTQKSRYQPSSQQNDCYRCGGRHAAQDCFFRDSECHKCGKLGHISRRCRSKGGHRPAPSQRNETKRGGTANFLQESSEQEQEPEEEYDMYSIRHADRKNMKNPIELQVLLNGQSCKMELDTGSAVSVINVETYKMLSRTGTMSLDKSSAILRTYSGEALKVNGQVSVRVQYEGQDKMLRALVVPGPGPNLMGRDWFEHIQLEWKSLFKLNMLSEVKLRETLEKYPDVFTDGIGTMHGIKAKIYVDTNAPPRYYKARPVPYAIKPKIEEELARLQTEEIIKPVEFSEWAAPIVPVMKENGKIRICGDYKITVNQASKLDRYPIPKIEDLLATLEGGEKFTKLDMSQAYQQMELDEDSKQYLTINTHKGLYRYNRLPFGVSSASGIFQRTMENLLQGIPHIIVRSDDILISGKDDEHHVEILDQALQRLSKAGVRLNKEKCIFMAPQVVFCGQEVSKTGIKPVDKKVRAITDAPTPKSVSELKSYLGMLNFYHRYLPDISTVLAPLHFLLQKGVAWKWGKKQDEAYKESKEMLLSTKLLTHYDPNRELILACDASPVGVGAVISHKMDDGTERPISFASRSLSAAEKNYSQIDKEGLALIFGVKKFHNYLYGRKFTLYTDHKPLVNLFAHDRAIPAMAAARIQRWALTLSAYEYDIVYREGLANANADAMSRLPLTDKPKAAPIPGETIHMMELLDSTPINANNIRVWTSRDPNLSRALKFTEQGWPEICPNENLRQYWVRRNELSVQDGCLLWGCRVVIPPQGQKGIMDELHEAHPGIVRMKMLARSYVWWPRINQDLEQRVRNCNACQANQKAPSQVPMHPWEWPNRAWSRIHVDYAGPFHGSMFLIIVDAYSKWIDVHPTKSSTSETTIEKLRVTFANQGLPEILVSDNGPCFTSEEFKLFMTRNGIRHITSAAYHPSSNGLAERAVQTFKESMRKMEGGTLNTKVARFLFRYRMTPQTVTGLSPAEMLNKRKFNTHFDLLQPRLDKRIQKQQELQKAQHDQHTKPRQANKGEEVYVSNFGPGQKWVPGIVTKESDTLIQVQLEDGREIRRHLDHARIKHDHSETPATSATSTVMENLPESITPVVTPAGTTTTKEAVQPGSEQTPNEIMPRYPQRERRQPQRFQDYVK